MYPRSSASSIQRAKKAIVSCLILISFLVLLMPFSSADQPSYYQTPGTGVEWSLAELAETANGWIDVVGDAYLFNGEIRISAGDTLRMSPGDEVLFHEMGQIRIMGNLLAFGSSKELITFSAFEENPEPGSWKGLTFTGENLAMTHANVEYASVGIRIDGSRADSIMFSDCTFSNNLQAIDINGGEVTLDRVMFQEYMHDGTSRRTVKLQRNSFVTMTDGNPSAKLFEFQDGGSVVETFNRITFMIMDQLGHPISEARVTTVVPTQTMGRVVSFGVQKQSQHMLTNWQGLTQARMMQGSTYTRDEIMEPEPIELEAEAPGFDDFKASQVIPGKSSQIPLVMSDTIAPTTQMSIDGQGYIGNGAIYLKDGARLALEGMDEGGGIKQIWYSYNGGERQTYEGEIFIPIGAASITFSSEDRIGNKEEEITYYLASQDQFETPFIPSASIEMSEGQLENTLNWPFISPNGVAFLRPGTQFDLARIIGGDLIDLSGASICINNGPMVPYLGAFAIPATTTHISWSIVDELGNSIESDFEVSIDGVAPTTWLENENGDALATEFVLENGDRILIDSKESVPGSGIAKVEYRPDGGKWMPYLEEVPNLTPGIHDLEVRAIDNAGNVEEPILFSIEVKEDSESNHDPLAASDPEELGSNAQMLKPAPLLDIDPVPAIAIILVGITLAILFSMEAGKYWLLSLILLPLYSRIKREKVLDHFIRGRIYEFIEENPGVHFNAIKKRFDMANGKLTYHLSVLEREEFVRSRTKGIGLKKKFYPWNMVIPEEDTTSPTSIRDKILDTIQRSPGICQAELANSAGTSQQLVYYHLRRLEKDRVVIKRKLGRRSRYFVRA